MKANVKVQDNFRKRDYPNIRKSRKPLTYQHVDDPIGRCWLCILLIKAEELVSGADKHLLFERKFKQAGITRQKLYEISQNFCPEYAAYYARHAERPLTPKICYERWHKKAVYKNGPKGEGGNPTPSAEFYTDIKSGLRACFPLVANALMTKRSSQFSLIEMRRLGTPT